jgi:penicillin-insensitive murein DD-endopeptidase
MWGRTRTVRAVVVLTVVGPAAFGVGSARAQRPGLRWASAVGPSRGPARVVGRHASACIAGAVPLPLAGPGYQAVDVARRRHFGHPVLVDFIGDLGRAAAGARIGTMLVGDMAQPRGGPMSSGHVSHQGGLDVDIWFRLDLPALPPSAREGIAQPTVVDPRTGRPDPALWTARHAELVRLAAIDPRVSRVFVGAAIKRDLCERAWPDRAWLRAVRPWPGHDDHLHVRLHCPTGSPDCEDQPALPDGEDCGTAALAAAFARERAERDRPPPEPTRVLPRACEGILTAR